jgi:hypothetical protein
LSNEKRRACEIATRPGAPRPQAVKRLRNGEHENPVRKAGNRRDVGDRFSDGMDSAARATLPPRRPDRPHRGHRPAPRATPPVGHTPKTADGDGEAEAFDLHDHWGRSRSRRSRRGKSNRRPARTRPDPPGHAALSEFDVAVPGADLLVESSGRRGLSVKVTGRWPRSSGVRVCDALDVIFQHSRGTDRVTREMTVAGLSLRTGE